MHLRDEAHRFGITHHRNKRSKGQIESELKNISGLGIKSEEKLLKSFRSVAAIKRASFEELEKIAGKKIAGAIIEHFAKASTR